jgi:hypothetical protein
MTNHDTESYREHANRAQIERGFKYEKYTAPVELVQVQSRIVSTISSHSLD